MSPVGGVGINLAIQDAVAAANRLTQPLLDGSLKVDDLRQVQNRRTFPTRMTQWMQVQIQKRILSRVLASRTQLSLPWPMKIVRRFPVLARIPAQLIGIGFRPEHVRSLAHLISPTHLIKGSWVARPESSKGVETSAQMPRPSQSLRACHPPFKKGAARFARKRY